MCRWIIKAHVANKSYIREYSNANGSGKVFSVGLVDRSGEIQLIGFNSIAERFYEKFDVGKVSRKTYNAHDILYLYVQTYLISKARIVPANQNFNSFKHMYQMVLKLDSIVNVCEENNNDSCTDIFFNFVPIKEIKLRKSNTVCGNVV